MRAVILQPWSLLQAWLTAVLLSTCPGHARGRFGQGRVNDQPSSDKKKAPVTKPNSTEGRDTSYQPQKLKKEPTHSSRYKCF